MLFDMHEYPLCPKELLRAMPALSPPLIQPKLVNAAAVTTAALRVVICSQAETAGRHPTMVVGPGVHQASLLGGVVSVIVLVIQPI